MNLLGLIVILLLIFVAAPVGPWYANPPAWGWYPSGGLGLVLLVLIILAILRG